MKLESVKLNKDQIDKLLRFRKAVMRFLRTVEGFNMRDGGKKKVIKKMIGLRKEILRIKHESVIFYDFSDKFLNEINKIKFNELKNIDQLQVNVKKNQIEANMKNKLETRSNKKLLENKFYGYIIFHLAEIYADYYEYRKIIDDIVSKKDSIHPDLLETYLAGDFYMLNWHTFDHIDDLAAFDGEEFLFTKGLMSNISNFLEEMDEKNRV